MTPEQFIFNQVKSDFIMSEDILFFCDKAIDNYKKNIFLSVEDLIIKSKITISLFCGLNRGETIKQLCLSTGFKQSKTRSTMKKLIARKIASVNREKRPFIYKINCSINEFVDVNK